MSDRAKGLLLGLIASALWSSVFVAGRYATAARGVDPILTAALRFSIGAAAAVVFLAVAGRWGRLMRAARDLVPLSALGAVGIFGMGVLVFISASLTTSINGALILNANAIFIAVFALFLGERVPTLRFIGLFIGLAGCAVIVVGQTPPQDLPVVSNVLGSLAALGGAICWAAYTVAGKRYVRRHGGPEVATITLVAGAVMLMIVALARRPELALEAPEWLAIAWLGIFPTTIAMLMWYAALELVDASVLGPTQYVAPPLATLLGWWLLGEPLTGAFVAGAAAVVIGVWLATRPAPVI
ncbi:MAG: DMT family transporter [Armatimonadota bacterium]|jgi:drug/metabolite transporter (DMT)-like permease